MFDKEHLYKKIMHSSICSSGNPDIFPQLKYLRNNLPVGHALITVLKIQLFSYVLQYQALYFLGDLNLKMHNNYN